MNLTRLLVHLLYPQWRTRSAFPTNALQAIEQAVARCEGTHEGELRFVVEGGLALPLLLSGVTARMRALQLFAQLGIWDTEHNNGVLIYVQLADRQVDIVADRGIHRVVGADGWRSICALMEEAFASGRFEAGAIAGVQAVARTLAEHFPVAGTHKTNELPDAPVLL